MHGLHHPMGLAKPLIAHFHLQAGPELEIPGYGCEDHFAENDTLEHSWEMLAELIKGGHSPGIVCDLGMPVMLGSVRYNCRIYLLDGRLLLIRPKISLADDGNYRCVQGRAWRSRGFQSELLASDLQLTAQGVLANTSNAVCLHAA